MIVLYALVLPVILLFCGLSLDVGMLQLKKVQMQNAADAGALGAELEEERGTGNWVSMGKSDAGVNGFTDGANGITVTVVQLPNYGAYGTYYNAIQVTISQRVRTVFMSTVNGGYQTVTAQATALVPPCTMFMGNGSQTQYSFQTASANLYTLCPVFVNTGLSIDGFANLYAFGINVAGGSGASYVGGGTSQQSGSGTLGAPSYNSVSLPDPLANMAQPALGGCAATSAAITSGTATLYPGTYCGTSSTPGVTLSNTSVTLTPGLYVITGGASLTNATVSGTGVTIFFTKGTNGAGYGQFKVGGSGGQNSSLNLSAPTDTSGGAVAGVVFFFDRSWVPTQSHDIIFDTNSRFSGDGIWYAPHTGIYLWQNTFSIPNYGGFIADNMYVYNTGLIPRGNYSWMPGGSPFRTQAVLVQ